MLLRFLCSILILYGLPACDPHPNSKKNQLAEFGLISNLSVFDQKMPAVQPGDWLADRDLKLLITN